MLDGSWKHSAGVCNGTPGTLHVNLTKKEWVVRKMMLVMLGVAAGLSANAEVVRAKAPPVVDGKLDDACWSDAKWEGGFSSLSVYAAKLGGPVPKTEFAVAADDDAVYFAVRCHDPNPAELGSRRDTSLWVTDGVELHLCPTGRGFDIYHFAVSPVSKDVYAEFLSEGGVIQPDPYAPEWRHAVGIDGDAWVAEFAFPLSAFYMTRNSDWKTSWLMNVARKVVNPEKTPGRTHGYYGWVQLERAFLEPKNWRTLDGFPMRRPEDDILVSSAIAQIEAKDAGGLSGRLRLEVVSACAGRFEISASSGDRPLEASLRKGKNVVELPCRYKENGRFKTRIEVRNLDAGRTFRRDYPVLVDFETIAVRFTKPCYRGNFYPGQDADSVVGTVKVASGQDAELTLEGPGFPKRTLTVRGGEGEFCFDTKGFAPGDARLTVKAGADSVCRRIRNLPPTGHAMAWIEDGHLVVNGKAVFLRSIYADGYKQGRCFRKRYERDLQSFCLTKGFVTDKVTLTGSEERSEGIFDRRPSAAVLERIDKIIERNRSRDIVGYYISDEPECRLLSPIYLKYLYDYVAEKDPYRIVFTASRGGKAYTEIADLIETHPYMDCQRVEGGERRYGTHPRDMPRFLDDFDAWGRPDKCLGFLPTCFAYRWTSVQSDYPTFDEYVAHCWGMLIAGAKTLWPYAGHDIGDREALYEGVRYVFRQTAAYESFLLFGRHTRHPRKDDVDRGTWELDGDVLDVSVDYKTMTTTVSVPAKYNETLEEYETVRARVDRGEAARLGRDNQLLERTPNLAVDTNCMRNFGGGHYKLFDGTYEMVALHSKGETNAYVEISCNGFRMSFDKVRVWGWGLVDKLEVDVRKGGEWVPQKVESRRSEKYVHEVSLAEPVSAVKIRLRFPGAAGRPNDLEIYEIELPRLANVVLVQNLVSPKLLRDEGMSLVWNGADCASSEKWSDKFWMYVDVAEPMGNGGFTMKKSGTRYMTIGPDDKWLVFDIAAFHNIGEPRAYRAWFAYLAKLCPLGFAVSHPLPGIYSFPLPKRDKQDKYPLRIDIHGMTVDFNAIKLGQKPIDRVEVESSTEDVIAPGSTMSVRVYLSRPCEEVASELLLTPKTGGMKPFAVNGTKGLELRMLDEEGFVWGADVPVTRCGNAEGRSVFLKVTPLGNGDSRSLFGSIAHKFGSFGDYGHSMSLVHDFADPNTGNKQ